MRIYYVDRSYNSFLVYPADAPQEAQLYESVEAFADFCSAADDSDYFSLSDEAIDLLYNAP